MNLRFAFAVNNANEFEKKHFGDADKYMVYEQRSDEIVFVSEEINIFKMLDEEIEHGSKKKGDAIIKFLKGKGVNVLVSRQFGRNIRMINKHFIPVKISLEHTDEVISVLGKHLHWINSEWEKTSSDYKLFTMNSGILKTFIEK